jgi:hypothetical protein
MGTRVQSLRYAGQYHAVQAAPSYAQPNSQSVSERKIHVIFIWQFISGAHLLLFRSGDL